MCAKSYLTTLLWDGILREHFHPLQKEKRMGTDDRPMLRMYRVDAAAQVQEAFAKEADIVIWEEDNPDTHVADFISHVYLPKNTLMQMLVQLLPVESTVGADGPVELICRGGFWSTEALLEKKFRLEIHGVNGDEVIYQ